MRNGLPLFTDSQYEALGAPRNPALAANLDPAWFDLGICGPWRADLRTETQVCGMFQTPTLRNVATREVFFHNGVFHSLRQVKDFYNFRDTEPRLVCPNAANGTVARFDDVPARYRGNVDVVDPPFDRHLGDRPAMTRADEQDIMAFLATLTGGYRPAQLSRAHGRILSTRGTKPPSWAIAERLVAAATAGVILPGFAKGAVPRDECGQTAGW